MTFYLFKYCDIFKNSIKNILCFSSDFCEILMEPWSFENENNGDALKKRYKITYKRKTF